MKNKLLVLGLFAILTSVPRASAQWVVEDPAMLAQTLINTYIAQEQQQTLNGIGQSSREIERRIGDAGRIGTVSGAANVLQSLSASGTPNQGAGSPAAGSTCNELFRTIGDHIVAPDGTAVSRNANSYRKFNAAHQSAASYQAVLADTEARRQAVLEGIKATTEAVQKASDLATVQKLQAVASAQIAALSAIDGERSAALGTVLVQNLDNNTDDDKQEQARREERSVDLHSATKQFAQFLTPLGSRRASASSSRR